MPSLGYNVAVSLNRPLKRPRLRSRLEDFEGTERFEIVSHLGSGGMGVVYEAIDRDTNSRVALKTLSLGDPASIYRFKKEFRGLSDISHPNLVALYELFEGEGQWFFTMELIRGNTLREFLRPTGSRCDTQALTEVLDSGASVHTISPSAPGASPPPDIALVRSSMAQLAEGLHALHAAGRLHRDIKPNNILVSEEHRVLLVDFGLCTEFSEKDSLDSQAAVGTASYMSPEQAAQGVLGPASDWYSVGCVLYEVLTEALPFAGGRQPWVIEKQEREAADPRTLVSGLPDDLCDLTMSLLERDSAKRPSGAQVMQRLGLATSTPVLSVGTGEYSQENFFVGRDSHIAKLFAALQDVKIQASPQCVLIHGIPGIGKSALAREFCRRAQAQYESRVIVLSGRCYERELVPYKAVDTIVDSLSRYLGKLPSAQVSTMLPEHIQALTRLFPVLKTVRAIADSRSVLEPTDPQVARRLAIGALGQILINLSMLRPLIIRVDDFQWGDTDSAVLLAGLFRIEVAPNLLLLISYRRDAVATSEALQVLHESLDAIASPRAVLFLAVDRLSEEEARALALARMANSKGVQNEAILQRVAAESQGSPFFVEEMMRYLQSNLKASDDASQGASISLRETLLARVNSLSSKQRKLLDVVAIAGVPIPQEIAFRASGLNAEDETAVAVLRAGRLVRSNRESAICKLESYHDRIRELLVVATAKSEQESTYRALASAFEVCAPADVESIAEFYALAGDVGAASGYASKAASCAMSALAFKKAAMFYKMALRASLSKSETLELRLALAEALSSAGLGQEAGLAHLEVVKIAPKALALDQRRRAAESFMRAGHIERAVALFKEVLASVGLSFPETNRRALLNLLFWRVYLRLRGVEFRRRLESQIPPDDLIKIDVCGSCGLSFGVNDSFRGAEFQTRQVILALRAGEPGRVGLSLAIEAAYRALEGKKGRASAETLIERSRSLAEQAGDLVAKGFAQYSEALVAYQCGQWREAARYFDDSAQILMRDCRGHQANACQSERLAADALFFLGEIETFSQRIPTILQAAEERGDLHGATDMRTGSLNLVWLVRGKPTRAREECEKGERQWSERSEPRFSLQNYYAALAHINIDLYAGNGSAALARADKMWAPLQRSFLLRVSVVGAQAHFLRGRALVSAALLQTSSKQRASLRKAASVARSLSRLKIPCAKAWSRLIAAQVAQVRGQRDLSVKLLDDVLGAFRELEMMLCWHATSYLLGRLLANVAGTRMKKDSHQWALDQGIDDPEKFFRMVVPLA